MDDIKVVLKVDREYPTIDGFKVEDFIREYFELPSDVIPDNLYMSYNDLVNYTINLMGMTMESVLKNVEFLKRKNDITQKI